MVSSRSDLHGACVAAPHAGSGQSVAEAVYPCATAGIRTVLVVLLMLATIGCSRGQNSLQERLSYPEDEPAVVEPVGDANDISLPAPGSISVSAAVTDFGLVPGSSIALDLPFNRAYPGSDFAVFVPRDGVSCPAGSGMAYACYLQDFSGYVDSRSDLREHYPELVWQQTGDYADAWIGIANFADNRWEWSQLPANNIPRIKFPASYGEDRNSPYLSEDLKVLICVLLLGNDIWVLEEIHLTESPAVKIEETTMIGLDSSLPAVGAGYGTVGDQVSFNVVAAGQQPITFLWDFAGAALPGIVQGEDAAVELARPGEYRVAVTVWNAYGLDEGRFNLQVLAPVEVWESIINPAPYGASRLVVDGSDNVYVFATDYYSASVIKLDSSQELAWARRIDTGSYYAEYDAPGDIGITGTGNLVVACALDSSDPVSDNLLLLSFSANGELQWAKETRFGSLFSAVLSIGDIRIADDDSIYLAGQIELGAGDDVLIARTDTLGDPLWAYHWGQVSRDERGRNIEITAEGGIYVSYEEYHQDSNYDAGLLKMNEQDGLEWSMAWMLDAHYAGPLGVYEREQGGVHLIVSSHGGTDLLGVTPAGEADWGRSLPIMIGYSDTASSMQVGSKLVISGRSYRRSAIGVIDPSRGLTWYARRVDGSWWFGECGLAATTTGGVVATIAAHTTQDTWRQLPPRPFSLIGQGTWQSESGAWEALTWSTATLGAEIVTEVDAWLDDEPDDSGSGLLVAQLNADQIALE